MEQINWKELLKYFQKSLEEHSDIKKDDDSNDIFNILINSIEAIHFNLVFANENIKEWDDKGKIKKTLLEEIKNRGPHYPVTKYYIDKTLLYIYSHFSSILDLIARICVIIFLKEIEKDYIKKIYRYDIRKLFSDIKNNKIKLIFENKIISEINEIINFRNNFVHYWSKMTLAIPSENIEVTISNLYRSYRGINFWIDGSQLVTTIRDNKSFEIKKFIGGNSIEPINVENMIRTDFIIIQNFVKFIIDNSISELNLWGKLFNNRLNNINP